MNIIPRIIKALWFVIFLTLICLNGKEFLYAQNLIGQQVELVGDWNGQYIEVKELEQQDLEMDSNLGLVEGRIDEIDTLSQVLQIGPISVDWNDATEFEGLSRDDLASGESIKVLGRLAESAHMTAISIMAVSFPSPGLEITGVVTERKRRSDGSIQLTVLGVLVEISRWNYFLDSEMEERPDVVDMEEMYTAILFDRPLAIGVEFENNLEFEKDFTLGSEADDDILFMEQILTFQTFYPVTGNISLLLGFEILNEGEFQTEVDKHDMDTGIGREEMWLFFGNLFESGFSLQIGRQAFEDVRQWWWGDEELDTLTLHYNRPRLRLQLSIGQEMAKKTTVESRIDPEEEDLLRVIGQNSWGWVENQRLDLFFLYQYDHSKQHTIGEVVRESLEDPSDADLMWVGGRASGQLCSDRFGEFDYWLDGAKVFGNETLYDFEEAGPGLSSVSSRIRRDVSGWAFDAGFAWWTNLYGRPFVSLGYAWGSGDRQSDAGKDKSFRQTGLHKNEDRYQYYGKLLEPELSNLRIWTISLGFRFWESCAIELAYHDYRQVKPAFFLRGALIKAEPEGTRRDIGQEWDLVVIVEEWENLEILISGALFRSGAAYGALSDEEAYFTAVEMTYRF